jgi:hypothetical protein
VFATLLLFSLFATQAKAKLDEYLKNKPDADIQRRIKELDVKIATTSVSTRNWMHTSWTLHTCRMVFNLLCYLTYC